MNVTQILCAAGPVDAVTNQALACRRLFRAWGWGGEDYSPVLAAGMPRGAVRYLHELRAVDADVLILHYSGYARGLERIFDGRRPTLLIFHNITPPCYFWEHEPVDAVHCELAYGQLADLIQRVSSVAGVSEYNAEQLRALGASHAGVIPVLFDPDGLGPAVSGPPGGGPETVLFVGRLVPHKRQDLVIRAFARYHRQVPDARLVLVGTPLSAAYLQELERLAGRLAPGAVRFEQALAPEALADRYRQASVFLCLSEHEGFCIPLLEAFHFGTPVVARNAGAVGEVVGDGGVLLDQDDGVATIAALLALVIADGELRDELRARGQRRLAYYDQARVGGLLREQIEGLAA